MLLAPLSVSALRPPPMAHFSMPGSGSSQTESAMAHPTPAQPDTTRAIVTLFNLRPRWEPGSRLTSNNSLSTQTWLSKVKTLGYRLSCCVLVPATEMSCLISPGLHWNPRVGWFLSLPSCYRTADSCITCGGGIGGKGLGLAVLDGFVDINESDSFFVQNDLIQIAWLSCNWLINTSLSCPW